VVATCIFCRIVARESPADIEYEDEEVVAFRDIYPKAPIHLLIIPKRHVESVMALEEADLPVVGRLLLAARRIGEAKGLAERGYRLAIHCGPEGGQLVYHLHLHFLAGRLAERRVERR
jgi:histidine triad (HIT) family protein